MALRGRHSYHAYRFGFLEEGQCLNLASKRLQSEEYWYRELVTTYPYGLSDTMMPESTDLAIFVLMTTETTYCFTPCACAWGKKRSQTSFRIKLPQLLATPTPIL